MRGPTRSLISAFNCYSPSGKYRKFWKFSRGFNFCVKLHCTRNIFKNIYVIVTEDIFDTRNVRIFKEVEKKRGILYFFMSSGQLSSVFKAFGLRNLCYSKISVAMLLWGTGKGLLESRENSSQNEKKKYALRPNAAYLNS